MVDEQAHEEVQKCDLSHLLIEEPPVENHLQTEQEVQVVSAPVPVHDFSEPTQTEPVSDINDFKANAEANSNETLSANDEDENEQV